MHNDIYSDIEKEQIAENTKKVLLCLANMAYGIMDKNARGFNPQECIGELPPAIDGLRSPFYYQQFNLLDLAMTAQTYSHHRDPLIDTLREVIEGDDLYVTPEGAIKTPTFGLSITPASNEVSYQYAVNAIHTGAKRVYAHTCNRVGLDCETLPLLRDDVPKMHEIAAQYTPMLGPFITAFGYMDDELRDLHPFIGTFDDNHIRNLAFSMLEGRQKEAQRNTLIYGNLTGILNELVQRANTIIDAQAKGFDPQTVERDDEHIPIKDIPAVRPYITAIYRQGWKEPGNMWRCAQAERAINSAVAILRKGLGEELKEEPRERDDFWRTKQFMQQELPEKAENCDSSLCPIVQALKYISALIEPFNPGDGYIHPRDTEKAYAAFTQKTSIAELTDGVVAQAAEADKGRKRS